MTTFETLLIQLLASARITAAYAFHCLVCERDDHRSELIQALKSTDKRAFYFANRDAILAQLERANCDGAELRIDRLSASSRVDNALFDALLNLSQCEGPDFSQVRALQENPENLATNR